MKKLIHGKYGKQPNGLEIKVCLTCLKFEELYGEDIKCERHRVPDKNGIFRVGCRKCDTVLTSQYPEDGLCVNDV